MGATVFLNIELRECVDEVSRYIVLLFVYVQVR